MRARLAASLVATAAALMGCGPLPVSLSDAARSFGSRDYERVFERWTRDKQIYNMDSLENSLTVSATYKSWEFRQAYVERVADDYEYSAADRDALLAAERAAWESGNEFVVATTATRDRWADLGAAESPWAIYLENDEGVRVGPTQIERVSKPTPMMTAYFSYITVYRKVFVLRFPRTDPGGQAVVVPGIRSFSLVFTGALGHAALVWKVQGG